MRQVMCGVSALVVSCVAFGQNVLAQSLTSVPDNAIVMVKVNNLEQTSKKAAVLFQQWGLVAKNPMLADPLATMQGLSGVSQGVNRTGEAAFIYFNPQRRQPVDGQPYIVLVPVTDYPAFIKGFPDATTEEGISTATFPTSPDPMFIANWEGFAAISPNRTLLATKPTATKATGLAAKELVGKDIVAYVNFRGFRQQAIQGMGFGRAMVIGQVEQTVAADPKRASLAPVVRAGMEQLFTGVEHVINETQSITLGINLADDGVQTTMMAEFDPASYLGQTAAAFKGSNANLLTGLPDDKYVVTAGVAFDGAAMVKLIDDVAGPALVAANKVGADAKPIVEYIDTVKSMCVVMKAYTVGVSSANGKAAKSPLFDATAVLSGDAKGLIAGQKRMAAFQQEFAKLFNMPGGRPKTITTIVENVKTLDGVSFDHMNTRIESATPGSPEQKMMDAVYGEGGMNLLMGAVNANSVVISTFKTDAEIKKAIIAAKAQDATVGTDAATRQVAGKLPQNRCMVMYLDGSQLMTMVSKASESFTGVPLDYKIAAGQPPIGVTIGTDGSAVRQDIFVPSALVQSISAAVMEQSIKKENKKKTGGAL